MRKSTKEDQGSSGDGGGGAGVEGEEKESHGESALALPHGAHTLSPLLQSK